MLSRLLPLTADKVCDLVSDALVDACISADEKSRVVCECCTKAGMIMVFGEILTSATINYESIIRHTLREIGYDDPSQGLDYKFVNIIIAVEEQTPPTIGRSSNPMNVEGEHCDQCVVFGYASDETEAALMPLTHILAASLAMRLTEARKSRALEWLRPYGKVLVTCEYSLVTTQIIPQRVHTVVISIQHSDVISSEQLREDLMDQIIRRTIPEKYIDDDTIFRFNPINSLGTAGQFVTGMTGRRIAAETYGGWAPHSGGFSGKDGANLERSGAYAARWVAKSLVHSHLCHRVLIQFAYAPGVASPISVFVDSYGSGICVSGKSDSELLQIVRSNFDLYPSSIIRDLMLMRPIMFDAAKVGHFTPKLETATWEMPKTLTC